MASENISIEKTFSVEISKLYKAWTDEEALKTWWKPAGRSLRSVAADLEEGGTVKYTFETAENGEGQLVIEGEYETVKPEELLIYTWNWSMEKEPVENGAYKLKVEFAKEGEGSKLIITQESAADKEGIQPHQEGWENALEDLGRYLTA